jgi:hypothetical protein
MKKSFVLYLDSLDVLDELTDEQAGQILKAMRDFEIGNDPKVEGILKAIWIPFRNQLKRDKEKYERICLRNAENGKKGGRPKETQDNPENPDGYFGNPKEPKKAYSDNDSDNDSDSENENIPPNPQGLDVGSKNSNSSFQNGKRKKKIPPKKKEKEELDFSMVSVELVDAFKEFANHRTTIKKPMTQLALEKLNNRLIKFNTQDIISAIDKSIEGGWQGVFTESLKEKASISLKANKKVRYL